MTPTSSSVHMLISCRWSNGTAPRHSLNTVPSTENVKPNRTSMPTNRFPQSFVWWHYGERRIVPHFRHRQERNKNVGFELMPIILQNIVIITTTTSTSTKDVFWDHRIRYHSQWASQPTMGFIVLTKHLSCGRKKTKAAVADREELGSRDTYCSIKAMSHESGGLGWFRQWREIRQRSHMWWDCSVGSVYFYRTILSNC